MSAGVTVITAPDGTSVRLIAEEDYSRLQDERDDLRRTLAFVNLAYRLPQRSPRTVGALLCEAGQGLPEAQAMASVIAEVRAARRDV